MQEIPDNGPPTPPPSGSGPSLARRPGLARLGVPSAERIALTPEEAAKLVERLRQLCKTQGAELAELELAMKALRDSGYKQELSQVLRDAVTWPEAHPHVGALWVRRLVSSNNWNRTYPQALDELCRRGEIGCRAVIEFIELVAAKGRTQLVREAVRKNASWLRSHPLGWRVAARALAQVRLYHRAARWMADWRARPDLDPALLYALALALRGAGRESDAQEVVQRALAIPSAAQQFPVLKLWLAQEEALAGRTEGAAAALKDVQPLGWDDDSICLFYLTRGVIRVQRAEPESRAEAFVAAYDRIRDQFRRPRVRERDLMLRRQYRRCVSRMARDAGRWGAGLMAAWRSADRWSTLAVLTVVPGLQIFAPLYIFRLCRHRRGREK